MNPLVFSSKLIEKTQLTIDAYSFKFERPIGFDFSPGQYLKMMLDVKDPDDRGNSRFFSICSSPTEANHLMITTRIIQSSFKKTLVNLKLGTEVTLRGPHGSFVLDEDERPKVFLTGGIGITPFRSMFIYAHDKDLSAKIRLIASFTTSKEIVFLDELKSSVGENLAFIPTVTHLDESPGWVGEKGRIDAEMVKRHVENVNDSVYYIAGPGVMVEAMVDLVKSMGVIPKNIKSENFPGY